MDEIQPPFGAGQSELARTTFGTDVMPARGNEMAKEWIAVLRAADAAARWHVHQRRKGAAEEPYVNHLLEVATLVAEATDCKDPELVIAALLHDAIEDQEVPLSLIAEAFGEGVAKLVEEVTDDKTLEKGERKKRQVDNAHKKSPGPKFSNSRIRRAI